MSEALPGNPGPTLQRIYDELDPAERESVVIRLLDGSSAERLALVLRKHGHRVSASTIRTYRRSLTEV
ncbi:hypothetical protein ACFC36_15905 [Streptomyces rubiginosohelvolus]|uniref:hypothetical protein n=1 Tax=Streptomyces rubiginosohelvolus TaxID=67362 RepID=UPI0035DFF84F